MDLNGKIGLVTGVANDMSIAYGCAKAFRDAGAEVVMTYQNEKTRSFTEPLARQVGVELFLPLDVTQEGSMESVFQRIGVRYGRLDFALHSMAFAKKDDLHGRVVDCSMAGLNLAMDVSCHSFIRMAKLAEPLMKDGGTLLTMSYLGADKVVPNYGVMGLVKAALESAVRYMSAELGEKAIRVHAISPGPLLTRAASGISHFDELMSLAKERAPLHRLVSNDEVGRLAAFLVSDWAATMTGSLIYADGGFNVMA